MVVKKVQPRPKQIIEKKIDFDFLILVFRLWKEIFHRFGCVPKRGLSKVQGIKGDMTETLPRKEQVKLTHSTSFTLQWIKCPNILSSAWVGLQNHKLIIAGVKVLILYVCVYVYVLFKLFLTSFFGRSPSHKTALSIIINK